jgi:hypothetical protein
MWDEWSDRPDLPRAAGNQDLGKFGHIDDWIESASEDYKYKPCVNGFMLDTETP